MTESQEGQESDSKNAGMQSFCVPRAGIEALLAANADAITIAAYLTLACFTEETGVYSTAGHTALRKHYGGTHRLNDDRAKTAIEKLTKIRVSMPDGKKTTSWQLVYTREQWVKFSGESLEDLDGPVARSRVLHVLPGFNENLYDRVWFGAAIVRGYGEFKHPLKVLEDAGNLAARILLRMYLGNNAVEQWGGVVPSVVFKIYKPTAGGDRFSAGVRFMQWGCHTLSSQHSVLESREQDKEEANASWRSFEALESAGFFYWAVTLLNKNYVVTGSDWRIAPDCQAVGVVRNEAMPGGFVPVNADTLAEDVQSACGALLDGKKPNAISVSRQGFPISVAGIARLRFVVYNNKNAGVKDGFLRIRDNHAEIRSLLNVKKRAAKSETPEPPRDSTEVSDF